MREGGEEESLPSWSLCGMAVATSQYRTRGPGRAGPATMLGQGQPLASVMIWLPGSPHHLHAGDPGHWLWVQITECVLGGAYGLGILLGRLPGRLIVPPSFPWSPRKQGTISQPLPRQAQVLPDSTYACEAPTLILAALKQDSAHQGPGPAEGLAPSLCTSCAPPPT